MSGMHIQIDLMTTQCIYKDNTIVEILQGFLRMRVFSEHAKLTKGSKKVLSAPNMFQDINTMMLYLIFG